MTWPTTLDNGPYVDNNILPGATVQQMLDALHAVGGSWAADARSAATIWNGTLGTGGTLAAASRLLGVGGSGGHLDYEVAITLGTGFAIGTTLTLPATVLSATGPPSADCFAWDQSANAWWPLYTVPATTTTVALKTLPAVAGSSLVAISGTVPFTFAAGDMIVVRHKARIA